MKKVIRSSKFIVTAGVLSKLLSLTKESLIASQLGSGAATDTYFTAIIAAYLLADIIGEGISLGIVPILSKIEAKKGKEHKLSFVNNLLHIVVLFGLGLIFLLWFFSPRIIRILARGIQGEDFKFMLQLVRIGLPIGLFILTRSVFVGFLHSEYSFKAVAKSWIYYYIVFIIYLAFFSKYGVYGLMTAGIIASMIQLFSILPDSIDKGYRYKATLNFKDVYFKELLIMLMPVVISTSVNMINVVIDKAFASTLVAGSKSWLNYSNAIIQLILGIFVTGIITVLLPMFSHKFNKEDSNPLENLLRGGTRLILSIIIPTMVVLISLSNPIVKLIFERGKFGIADTLMTSQVLIFYTLGLLSMSMILLLTNFYYAAHNPLTPMKFAFIGVLTHFILNFILIKPMAVNGLALANSLSSTLIVILLINDIHKNFKLVSLDNAKEELFKLLPVIISMTIVMVASHNILDLIPWDNMIINTIKLFISISLGILTYIKLSIKTKSALWQFTEKDQPEK